MKKWLWYAGLVLFSGAAGIGVLEAAVKFSFLNWLVDGPGWIVSRFTSIDFYEGDGAMGFILAILLAWLMSSLAIFLLTNWARPYLLCAVDHLRRNSV